jgi:nucleoside-triphosphatase THEP1
MEEGKTTGYDISDISTGDRTPVPEAHREVRQWGWNGSPWMMPGIAGRKALDPANNLGNDVVIVDEVGPFELKEGMERSAGFIAS